MDQSMFLNVVRRYLWLFVAATVVASLTTLFLLNGQPRVYEAKTRLLVGPTVDNPSPDLNALRIGSQLMQTYADLVTTRPFLEAINNKLEQKVNLEALGGMIETKQNADTRILTIIIRNRDPKEAVVIANAAAQSLVEMSPSKDNTTELLRTQMRDQSHQLEQIITNAETSIQDLEAKLVTLGDAPQQSTEGAPSTLDQQNLIIKQLTDERGRLSDALRTLATIYQVLLDTNTNQLQIIEPAGAVFPVNQNLSLRVTAAALAALLLVMSIVFAYEYFDDTIRVPGDFTRAVRVPLLSTIEKHDRLDSSGRGRVVTSAQPTSQAANSYRTVAAKLLFSIGKSMPYTYLLSSVGSQSEDDTAMATANLGVAFAQAGNRVVLVDAQFHNPVLTKLFEANGKAGLSDLLENKSSQLKLMPVKDMSNVQLLPAGMAPEKWPGAMLNSANVARLVEELQQVADIVLVAGPPISGFAESLSLASHVNGVILTARYGETHSKMINDVIESLSGINVQLAGVIFEQNPSPSPKSKAPKASGPIEKSNIPEQISK